MIDLNVFKCSFCGEMRDNMVCCLRSTHNDTPCDLTSFDCEECDMLSKICKDCATRIAEAD